MKAKRIPLLMTLILFTIGFWVPSAIALEILHLDRIGGYYYGNGGEFNISGTPYTGNYDSKAIVNNGFESFCLELNENVTIPGDYYYAISNAAIAGGLGGGSPDPISKGTAWLYWQFAIGALAGYDYTPGDGRKQSAGYLQEVIWLLEDEVTSILPSNPFDDLLIGKFGSLVAAKQDANGAYGVFVFNLYADSQGTQKKQDLLGLPEPTTLSMLGLGLVTFGIVSMRLKRRR